MMARISGMSASVPDHVLCVLEPFAEPRLPAQVVSRFRERGGSFPLQPGSQHADHHADLHRAAHRPAFHARASPETSASTPNTGAAHINIPTSTAQNTYVIAHPSRTTCAVG